MGCRVRHVIVVVGEIIQVADARVGEVANQFPFGLLFNAAADFESDGPFVQEFAQRVRQTALKTVLQRLPANPALEQLKALVCGGVRKTVDQQRNSKVVQNPDARHVHSAGARVADVEGKEVQVVVDGGGIAVELGVAADF